MAEQRRVSVSTWSLHRTLGRPSPYGPGNVCAEGDFAIAAGAVSLLDLPLRLADFGIHTLEICHFHLPERSAAYLEELRRALDAAEVELWSLLIDGGDVTDPVHGERDQQWIAGWIETAGQLGAHNARVVAGQSAADARALEASKQALSRLCRFARGHGVRLTTENYHELLASAEAVLELMESQGGELGLCLDFGNWSGAEKYAELAQIAPLAESCHAKCYFDAAGEPDRADYQRCLAILDVAQFDGPYTLIYDGPNADEWGGLALERAMVEPYLG